MDYTLARVKVALRVGLFPNIVLDGAGTHSLLQAADGVRSRLPID